MGQHYSLTCPEKGTYINARCVCSSLKACEQIYSTSVPAALAFLCYFGNGSNPRDLPWAPKGQWAGTSPLMIGDYTEPSDLLGITFPYGQSEPSIYKNLDEYPWPLDDPMKKRKKLKNIGASLLPIIERVGNLRDFGSDEHGTSKLDFHDLTPVKYESGMWMINLDVIPAENVLSAQEWYDRAYGKNPIGLRAPINIRRDHFLPLSAVPTIVPSSKNGTGETLLWVNLTRCEFIDPIKLGDTPDLTGVMLGGSSQAVLATLIHDQLRGGGDLENFLPANIPGRWRGDKIILLGETKFNPKNGRSIDQSLIRAEFTDISDNARLFLDLDEAFNYTIPKDASKPRVQLNTIEEEIHAIVATDKTLPVSIDTIEITIVPPTNVSIHSETGTKIYHNKPSINLYVNEGKVLVSQNLHQKLQKYLNRLTPKNIALTKHDKSASWDTSLISQAIDTKPSNHMLAKHTAA